MMLRPGEILIGDHNWQQHCAADPVVDGERKSRGQIPRDYTTHPQGCYRAIPAWSVDMPLIPRSEWSERIRDKIASKSQLSDIRLTGNNGQMIPSLDQNGQGFCLPPGTRIRMADGSTRKIEDVRLLDEVLSAEGRVRRVMECYVHQHDGEMVTIKAWGHGHLCLTPNHEVLTRRGYIPAGELTSSDWIAIPRFAARTTAVIQTAAHTVGLLRRKSRTHVGAEQWEVRQPLPEEKGYVAIPDFIGLTEGAGRIFGLWLAEGHIDRTTRTVVWSFSADEADTLAAGLVRLLESEWGATAKTRPGPASPSVVQVTLSGVLWCQLFESLCGSGAGGKRPHADLMSGPSAFLEGMLRGWLDGDGCVKRQGKRGKGVQFGATISHDLALAMFDIANFLGLRPALERQKPQVNRHAKTRRPVWIIKYPVSPSQSLPCGYDYRVDVDERTTWRRVREVRRNPYSGLVYNFAVEVDNSYVAEGVGVHNCWAYSSTSCVTVMRAVQGQPYVRLSAHAVACKIKNFRDEGGWGAHSAEFITANGVPSVAFWAEKSMSRQDDKPETWENAKLHRIAEGWVDLALPVYDRNLTFEQYITCLLCNCPGVFDANFWSHSIAGLDAVDGAEQRFHTRDPESGKLLQLVDFDLAWGMNDPVTGGIGVRIWNSWGDGWSDRGMSVLSGSKAVPDGSVAIRVTTPSVV